MSPEIYVKISNNERLHNYLKNNPYWYKYLNRNKNNYKNFYNAFKQNNRNEKLEKASSLVDTLDIVNTIFNNLQ